MATTTDHIRNRVIGDQPAGFHRLTSVSLDQAVREEGLLLSVSAAHSCCYHSPLGKYVLLTEHALVTYRYQQPR
jgi:hypothetical protein